MLAFPRRRASLSCVSRARVVGRIVGAIGVTKKFRPHAARSCHFSPPFLPSPPLSIPFFPLDRPWYSSRGAASCVYMRGRLYASRFSCVIVVDLRRVPGDEILGYLDVHHRRRYLGKLLHWSCPPKGTGAPPSEEEDEEEEEAEEEEEEEEDHDDGGKNSRTVRRSIGEEKEEHRRRGGRNEERRGAERSGARRARDRVGSGDACFKRVVSAIARTKIVSRE